MRGLLVALVAVIIGATAPAASADVTATFLHESFATVADGPAPEVDRVTNFQHTEAGAPYVRGGYLTTADPDNAFGGSYRIAELDADVTRVGASFAFSPYTVKDGALCLSIQGSSIAEGKPVPTSPMHLVVSTHGWSVDVNTEAGTGVEMFAMGQFATPLVADGHTLHRVEVEVDRANGMVRVSLPDGSQRTFTDPAFRQAGRFVYVEPFKSLVAGPAADQTDALVSEWWADTQPVNLTQPVVDEAPANVTPEVAPPGPVYTPVAEAAPTAPSKVSANQRGARTIVKWRQSVNADTYAVRCGSRSKTANGSRVWMRSSADQCKVKAVNSVGASSWVRVAVKPQR